VLNAPVQDVDILGLKKCNDNCNDPEKAPVYLIGSCSYYKYRYESFKKRHPNCDPPDYYLGYGWKYCTAFAGLGISEYKENRKLYDWVFKTTISLQKAIEKGLQDKEIKMYELDGEKFRKFAFSTHADAYWNSGLYELGPLDLSKIVAEPDLREWYGENRNETWAQAFVILKKLYNYHVNNEL